MTTPIARVNKLLKQAGRAERLIRNSAGGGYYYLTETLGESLYVYSLDDTPHDHKMAVEYVEAEITRAEGKPFKLEPVLPTFVIGQRVFFNSSGLEVFGRITPRVEVC